MHIMQPHEQFSKILEICKSFMPGMFNWQVGINNATISLRTVSAALSGLMFFLYSLQGLTPLPIELPPSYLGLLNSAHLRFAIQLCKLELGHLSPRRQPWSSPRAKPAFHPAEGR